MKIPTWKVALYEHRHNDNWQEEYQAHTVDDAIKMFMVDCGIVCLEGETHEFVAQCTNYGDGAILKVVVKAVPQVAYEMTVEPL